MKATLINTFSISLALAFAPVAFAQSGNDGGECSGGLCGSPNQTGGGGCGCGGGSILINFSDIGDTYQFADDYDSDGFEDDFDNCPFAANFEQQDTDGDSVGDVCDSCLNAANAEQTDTDADGAGDACDSDIDDDGFENDVDNCVFVANPSQNNADNDQLGNACDDDDDNDGVLDVSDTCALVPNVDQSVIPENALCDGDQDGDSIPDSVDNCLTVENIGQANLDGDEFGDDCDFDIDNDGIDNSDDNCERIANPDQLDEDRDLVGSACDQRLCYVVRRVEDIAVGAPVADPNHCLDPNVTFTVLSLPFDLVEVGQERRLQIFANRDDQVLRYEWRVLNRPEGSDAGIRNATGSASQEGTNLVRQYDYVDGPATFTPDMPGLYTLELRAELAQPDPLFPGANTAVTTFELTAEGEDSSGGCNTAPGQTNTAIVWLLTVAGFALVLRRRVA
ncbi:MAG: thrombospondin type 3 repeat-containing protein [Myxococcota bacterium]